VDKSERILLASDKIVADETILRRVYPKVSKPIRDKAIHHPNSLRKGGHAEPVIGRAFARPGGFAHPTAPS
jgi:hypothetical protein